MNYDKLPKSEHAKVIMMVNSYDFKGLLLIHDKYKLTEWDYSCCGEEYLHEHFKHGIEQGKIKAD